MKTTSLLARTRKAVQAAQAQTLTDEKAARIAKETAHAAKIKLKYARKIAKLARRAAKSARQKVAESLDALKRTRKKLKKLEKHAVQSKEKSKKSRKAQRAKSNRKVSAKKPSHSAKSKPATRLRTRVKPSATGPITHSLLKAEERPPLSGNRPSNPPAPMEVELELGPDGGDSTSTSVTGLPDKPSGVPAA